MPTPGWLRSSRPARRWRRASLLAVLAGLLAPAAPALAQSDAGGNDFFFGFIQFVRWPQEEQVERWQVCHPASASLPAAPSGRQGARGKPIVHVAVTTPDQAQQCQILDLTGLPPKEAAAYLQRVRQSPVLTVGSGQAFCTAGGVACTRVSDVGGGFEINLSAAQLAGLKIGAQLLLQGRKREMLGAMR